MSSTRLISTASFHAGRTMAAAVPRAAACSWLSRPGISLGECSVSNRIQSKPESDTISAAMLLARLLHSPICNCPAAMARLKLFSGRCMSSHELHRDAAERPEVGMQRIALLREHDAGEGAGQHQVARLQRDAMGAELVGEPRDAERRMAEHAGGHAGLL